MSTLQIPTARAFRPFLEPARYKGAYGGRGSGKSHFFAGLGVEECFSSPTRLVCIREIQKDLKQSAQQLILDKIKAHGLSDRFGLVNGDIHGPHDSLIIFRGMQNYNSESIKSLEGFKRAWLTEASAISQRSLDLLRPTIRADESEIWADWNPESEFDPIDLLLRGKDAPPEAIVRSVNWRDNPWFPAVLRAEMNLDRQTNAAKAAHTWDGDYAAAPTGAYYADLLAKALAEGRVGRVPHDPRLEVHVSFDLGAGQHQALLFSQRAGREVRLIETLQGDEEAANEGYAWYARKMRERPYTYAPLVFPHDGRVREATGKSRAETMESLNFKVETLPILPVDDGIEAVKRLLPITWIDAEKCASGLLAWKSYREDWDEKLRRSNGPLKDWTNHFADTLRYTAIAYEEPPLRKKAASTDVGAGSHGWMGG